MGGAGASSPPGGEDGTAARLAPAPTDRRHTVPGPDRCSVAGCPRRVRPVGPGLRPTPPMAAERHLASDPHQAPVPGRCEGRDHVGPERRLHGLPCPSACGRKPASGATRRSRRAASSPSHVITAWEGRAAADLRASTRPTTVSAMRSSAGSTDRHRAVATRFDKLAVRHEASVLVAAINEWL